MISSQFSNHLNLIYEKCGCIVTIFLLKISYFEKVDYQTKAKNRSRGGEPFSNVASNKSNSTVINGSGTSSHGDFNGPINHIAIVPPLMKSTVIPSNHQQQQQRTSLPLQPSSTPHNMSLPLTSTSSSSACQFGLDGGK